MPLQIPHFQEVPNSLRCNNPANRCTPKPSRIDSRTGDQMFLPLPGERAGVRASLRQIHCPLPHHNTSTCIRLQAAGREPMLVGAEITCALPSEAEFLAAVDVSLLWPPCAVTE